MHYLDSILKIKKPTSHFEDHLRSDVAYAVPTSHFENHLRNLSQSSVASLCFYICKLYGLAMPATVNDISRWIVLWVFIEGQLLSSSNAIS